MTDLEHTTNDPSESTSQKQTPDDRFYLKDLRLGADLLAEAAVKRVVTTVPVRRPSRTTFIRVRSGPEWTFETYILELKQAGETYLVARDLWSAIPNELVAVRLHVSITREGNLFLLPVRLPGPDGRTNPWHESLAAAVGIAMRRWVRVVANTEIGGYDLLEAQGNLPEPRWPDLTLDEIVRIAFRNRLIESLEHPVLGGLFGTV